MLSGKAYSRALRGHLILDQVLKSTIFEKMTLRYNQNFDEVTQNIESFYNDLVSSNIQLSDLESNSFIKSIDYQMKETRLEINKESRTPRLWSEYQNVIDIIRTLITADRIGNWQLQLEAINQALPIFAAAGHYNSSKSACLYLQNMLTLDTTNPLVYERFKGGNFIVRRSDRYWAGLPCDLITEQVLMRLTRGPGMSDVTRAIWLMSKPVCSEYGYNMEGNIGVLFTTSEQHRTATQSRINRDRSDTIKIHQRLVDASPFKDDISLHNIFNGVTAAESVNVDRFHEIGQELIAKMEGQDVFKYVFKRKERAKNMSIQVTLSKQKDIKCDPALLFQRLLLVGQLSPVDLDEIMSFELSAYPLSIFEKPTLLRKADKPKLVGAIVKFVKEHSDEVSEGEGSELMNKDELLVNDIEMEIVVDNYSNDSSYKCLYPT